MGLVEGGRSVQQRARGGEVVENGGFSAAVGAEAAAGHRKGSRWGRMGFALLLLQLAQYLSLQGLVQHFSCNTFLHALCKLEC